MEPLGLALSRMPFSIGPILFLVFVAILIFVVARWMDWHDEDGQ